MKKMEASEKRNAFLIFFRLSFAHKTGQMPWNFINISCKSDNQIAWFSITGSQDKQLCCQKKFAEIVF